MLGIYIFLFKEGIVVGVGGEIIYFVFCYWWILIVVLYIVEIYDYIVIIVEKKVWCYCFKVGINGNFVICCVIWYNYFYVCFF